MKRAFFDSKSCCKTVLISGLKKKFYLLKIYYFAVQISNNNISCISGYILLSHRCGGVTVSFRFVCSILNERDYYTIYIYIYSYCLTRYIMILYTYVYHLFNEMVRWFLYSLFSYIRSLLQSTCLCTLNRISIITYIMGVYIYIYIQHSYFFLWIRVFIYINIIYVCVYLLSAGYV